MFTEKKILDFQLLILNPRPLEGRAFLVYLVYDSWLTTRKGGKDAKKKGRC
jgi:hypothetical protein